MKLGISISNIGRIARSRSPSTGNMGLFGNLLLSNPRGFNYLANVVEEKSLAMVREIINKSSGNSPTISSKTTVSMLDDLSNEICCAADLSDCVRNMHCDPIYSKAAEDSMRRYTILVETFNTTPGLYYALKKSLDTERNALDEVSLRTAKLLLEDFENSGVHLNEEERKRFVELSDLIFDAGANFVNGVDASVRISDTEAAQYGLSFNELHGPWSSTPDYKLRRFTYSKYFAHNDEQEIFLRRLVTCRTELSKLTGFETFAHRSQLHTILRTYDNVQKFLNALIKSAIPSLESEVDAIRRIVNDNSRNFDASIDEVGEWDLEFATSFERRRILNDELSAEISKYLNIDTMLSGVETVVNRLYGLSFQVLLPDTNEVWPGNVIKLNVFHDKDANTTFLGTIYLDIDNRPSKVQGDCHFTVRCSKLLDNGEYQTPIVVISLSIIPPELQNQQLPSGALFENVRMSIQQAENFFHEMGHAIHSMLGRTRFQHVAGTRCSTDFAEVPSHLMECFFNDSQVLREICRDKSGRPMANDEAEALASSRKIFRTANLLQQSSYALFDVSLHGDHASDFANGKLTSTELFKNVSEFALPNFAAKSKNYAYHHRISHLVTYGAKYYSYLIARSVSSLIYKNLFQDDPFSRDNGLKWAKVQSHGGEYPPHHLLECVLKKSPSTEELISVLVGEK